VTTPERIGPAPTAADSRFRRLGVVPALDGVRGVAVLLVVVVHLKLLFPYGVTGWDSVDTFIDGGILGVDLFFVLSGFLITALLLRELDATNWVRFGAFYARRALRLLPALYLLLAVHAVVVTVTHGSWAVEYKSILGAVLYVNNWQQVWWRETATSPDLIHLWSLAIEEQFYLIWPALLVGFLGLRRSATTVAIVLVSAIVAIALWKAHLYGNGDLFRLSIAIRTDTRADALLVGALAASLWVRRATPLGMNGLGWAGLAVGGLCIWSFDGLRRVEYHGGLTLFAVAGAVVILALVEGRWPARTFFEWAPLRAVGRVSYGIYLWHYFVFWQVAQHAGERPPLIRLSLALGLTTVGVLFSWYVVEQPALRIKARLGGHRPDEAPDYRVRPAEPPGSSVAEEQDERPGTDTGETEELPTMGTDDDAPDLDVTGVPADQELVEDDDGWDEDEEDDEDEGRSTTGRPRALWVIGVIVVLLLGLLIGRITSGDDDGGGGAQSGDGGVPFPTGDVNREGYWGYVGLERLVSDTFDRDADPQSLGQAGSGQDWDAVSGTWGVEGGVAQNTTAAPDGPSMAVVPEGTGDGLTEVTMNVVEQGAGLVFRYLDPDNYWTVTANPGVGSWTVTRVLEGEDELIGELPASTADGTTISVEQKGSSLRFLVEGVEYLSINDGALGEQLQGGLIAPQGNSGTARWNRFLVMQYPADQSGG